ncbi:MAG: hypothetical protein ACTSX9_01570 [Candidatus Njordarchaeales archaeon]
MPIILHTIFIQRSDGSPVVVCGKTTRDPTMLAALVTALKELSEELSLNNARQANRANITFHNFGDYFLAMINRGDLIAAIVTDTTEIQVIGEIISLLSRLFREFEDSIWDRLDEKKREIGLVPNEYYREYIQGILDLITRDTNWRGKVFISPFFIASDAGLIAIDHLLLELIQRLNKVLGPKLAFKFLKNLSIKLGITDLLLIKYGKEKKNIEHTISIQEYSEEVEELLQKLATYYLKIIKQIQKALHIRGLEFLAVIQL